MRVADDVLIMPLYGINPVFAIKAMIEEVGRGIGIGKGLVYIVGNMVLCDAFFKYFKCFFAEHKL